MRLQPFTSSAFDAVPRVFLITFALAFGAACAPKVQVVTPDKPIEVNLNIKVEHEITVKVDKSLDTLFAEEEDIF